MKYKLSVILCIVGFLFSSCNTEEIGNYTKGEVNVTFSVALPVPQEVYPGTRASYTDVSIENIDLLVFDKDNKFIERLTVEKSELASTVTGVKFTVLMDATPDKRTVHLIANGRSPADGTERINYSVLTAGMHEDVAIPLLQTTTLASKVGQKALLSNILPLVMWSRITLNSVSIVTKADNVKLLRAAAGIRVQKGPNAEANGSFTIQNICIDKGADVGKVAPSGFKGLVATPSVANPVVINNYIPFDKTYSEDAAVPELYVYERKCSANDYMGVIVKAQYKNRTGYYKIVMTDPAGKPMDIIRNHRYNIIISEVNGHGYQDINTAVNSAPSNDLKIEVVVNEDKEFPCVIADSEYSMGVTNNELHVYGRRGQNAATTDVELCRVYSSRGIAPVSIAGHNWLTNIVAQPLGNNVYRITGTLNYSQQMQAVENTTITLWCDNLSHTINVSWIPAISTTKDSDSYVVTLVSSNENNWKVNIIGEPDWVWLHASASAPGAYPGGGMVRDLTSKYSGRAYLHVGAANVNRRAEVMMSCLSNNNDPVSRKIMVIQ